MRTASASGRSSLRVASRFIVPLLALASAFSTASCRPLPCTLTNTCTNNAPTPFTFAPGSASLSQKASASADRAVAEALVETDGSKTHSALSVTNEGRPLLKLESWSWANGTLLLDAQSGPDHLQWVSLDGTMLTGTLNGRDLQPLPRKDLREVLKQTPPRYADGSEVKLTPPDPPAQQAIEAALRALQAKVTPPAGNGMLPGGPKPDPPAYDPASPARDDVINTGLCQGCENTAWATFAGCMVTAVIAAVGCGWYYLLCEAAGVITCDIIFAVQYGACSAQGNGCCPVPCGASGCCQAGHQCFNPANVTCCAVPCGSGCCMQGDACFLDAARGASQCCPAGQPHYPFSHGGETCCQVGDTANLSAATPEAVCCPAGSSCGRCGGLQQPCCANGRCLAGGGCASGVCVGCPPALQTRPIADTADQFAGNNCFGNDFTVHLGRPCDTGFVHGQCTATVLHTNDSSAFCQATWVAPGEAGNCKCDIHFHTSANCFNGIDCVIHVDERQAGSPPPAGCP